MSNATSSRQMTLGKLNDFFSTGGFGRNDTDLSEITYYTCLKILSESLGKLPCYVMDAEKRRVEKHAASYALNVRPNDFQTPAQFFTYLEFCRNHYGNCYVFINRSPTGKLESLLPLEPRRIQIWVNNTDHFTARRYYYVYNDIGGKQYFIAPEEIIHVKCWLADDSLLVGRSVREVLATSLAGSRASTAFLNDLYQQGLLARAVVKHVGDLKPANQELLLKRLEEQANKFGRRVIALPVGFDLQTVDMKLTDSQFFELKRYSAQQIAAVFGVEPNQLNDYSKASYANSVAQNLSFYVDTLLAILSQYEQEFRTKLLTRAEINRGLRVKFNVNVILRADPASQAEIIAKFLANGVYTLDEARGWLDMPPYDDELGHMPIINAAYKPLADIGKEEEPSNQEPTFEGAEDTESEETDDTEEVEADDTSEESSGSSGNLHKRVDSGR